MSWSFQEKRRIRLCFCVRKRLPREKRIVAGVQKQGWHSDSRQKWAGARTRPVVSRIAETVKRRGIAVVKLLKSPDLTRPLGIEFLWKAPRFGLDFGYQRLQETAPINSIASRR